MTITEMAPPHVLVVDDNAAKRYVISQILRSGGYGITEVACGEDALSSVTEQRPDVIVLDVELPDISGFEVCAVAQD